MAQEEAKDWFTRHPKAFLAGNRFDNRDELFSYLNELYQAGAEQILIDLDEVVRPETAEPCGQALIVVLPTESEKRSLIFELFNQEVEQFGQDFGGDDGQSREMTLEEAQALGDPSLEGELVYIDSPLADTGQQTLTFWWD